MGTRRMVPTRRMATHEPAAIGASDARHALFGISGGPHSSDNQPKDDGFPIDAPVKFFVKAPEGEQRQRNGGDPQAVKPIALPRKRRGDDPRRRHGEKRRQERNRFTHGRIATARKM